MDINIREPATCIQMEKSSQIACDWVLKGPEAALVYRTGDVFVLLMEWIELIVIIMRFSVF